MSIVGMFVLSTGELSISKSGGITRGGPDKTALSLGTTFSSPKIPHELTINNETTQKK